MVRGVVLFSRVYWFGCIAQTKFEILERLLPIQSERLHSMADNRGAEFSTPARRRMLAELRKTSRGSHSTSQHGTISRLSSRRGANQSLFLWRLPLHLVSI